MDDKIKFSLDVAIQQHDKSDLNLQRQKEEKVEQEKKNQQELENFISNNIKPILTDYKRYLESKTKRGEILEGKKRKGSIELHMFLTNSHDDNEHPAIHFSPASEGQIKINAGLWSSLDQVDEDFLFAVEKISDITKDKIEKHIEYLIKKSLE